MKFNTKLLASIFSCLVLSPLALAAGPYDGAYSCQMSIPAFSMTIPDYIVFLTHPDGSAAFSHMAPVQLQNTVTGYGFGALNGNTFTGTSGFNSKVSFQFTQNSDGSVTMNMPNSTAIINGTTYPTPEVCTKIF